MKYPLILTLLLSTTKKEINNHKCLSPINVCRDDQTRTGDLAPPRRVRYQLRYIPILLKRSAKVGKLQDIAKYIPWFSIKKVI